MIEMLGVLSIIGVLSIGGLVTYRQAMFNYQWNEFSTGLSQINQNILENCIYSENCPFEGWNNTQPNFNFLCQQGIQIACVETNTNYAYNSKLKLNWLISASKQLIFYSFSFRNKRLCQKIVTYNWPRLSRMEPAGISGINVENGKLSDTQKNTLNEWCNQDKLLLVNIKMNF